MSSDVCQAKKRDPVPGFQRLSKGVKMMKGFLNELMKDVIDSLVFTSKSITPQIARDKLNDMFPNKYCHARVECFCFSDGYASEEYQIMATNGDSSNTSIIISGDSFEDCFEKLRHKILFRDFRGIKF